LFTVLEERDFSPVVEVDDLVEEKCPASGAREPGADQFGPVGQDGVAGGAGKEARAPDVSQEYATHFSHSLRSVLQANLSVLGSCETGGKGL
jgi:hypothetical protein